MRAVSNADGSNIYCTDTWCSFVPDDFDPFASHAKSDPGTSGSGPSKPHRPQNPVDTLAGVAKAMETFGVDISSVKAQFNSEEQRERLTAKLAQARQSDG
jgi:hypothetical protein